MPACHISNNSGCSVHSIPCSLTVKTCIKAEFPYGIIGMLLCISWPSTALNSPHTVYFSSRPCTLQIPSNMESLFIIRATAKFSNYNLLITASFERVSSSPGGLQILCVPRGVGVLNFCSEACEGLLCAVLGIKPRVSSILGKHSIASYIQGPLLVSCPLNFLLRNHS